jgi:hypothetical protein
MTSNYNLKELCTDSKGKLIEEIYFPLKRRIKTYLVNNKEDKIIWPDPNNLLKYWSTLHIAKKDYMKQVDKYISESNIIFDENKYKEQFEKLVEEDQNILAEAEEEHYRMYEELKEPEEIEIEDNIERYENNFNNSYFDSLEANASGYFSQPDVYGSNFMPSPRHE